MKNRKKNLEARSSSSNSNKTRFQLRQPNRSEIRLIKIMYWEINFLAENKQCWLLRLSSRFVFNDYQLLVSYLTNTEKRRGKSNYRFNDSTLVCSCGTYKKPKVLNALERFIRKCSERTEKFKLSGFIIETSYQTSNEVVTESMYMMGID